MSLATAFNDANTVGLCGGSDMEFHAEVRIKMAQTVQAIVLRLVTEVAAYGFIMQQAVLREVCAIKLEFVSNEGELYVGMIDALQGFESGGTSSNRADHSGRTSVMKDNYDCISGHAIGCNDGKTFLLETAATVDNGATSNDDSSPEKGSVQRTDGIANWVLTAAKGKEQDDDDVDDDDDDDEEEDDGDDDDYEEEADDDNDNKIEPGDDEEDVEGEDEEGDDEAGEEDGDDDGEAEDNGEAQDDDGEEGEEEEDVEGDEDGDEDGDEEQEDEDEDGEEEDPEDEDEDEVEGESEEDIEDLEPPKKKRK